MSKERATVATQFTSQRPFERFLVETLREWLREQLASGKKCHRYQFSTPNASNSTALFNAFQDQCDSIVRDKKVELRCFSESDVAFIPVLCGGMSDEAFTENYVSRLRDLVAAQSNEFAGSALIVIHDSLLDTLINSADDLGAQGAIWDPRSLEDRLVAMTGQDRVSRLLLDQRLEQIIADGDTVFGLKPIYKALDDGKLEFSELDLFDDPLLLQMEDSKVQIKNRLETNRKLFERLVFLLETYPDQKEERLKQENFSESFIRRYFNDDGWKRSLNFQDCLDEQARNKSKKVKFKDISGSKALKVLARPRDTKAAGQRDQALILVHEDPDSADLKFIISFEGDPVRSDEVLVQTSDFFPIETEVKFRSGVTKLTFSIQPTAAPRFFTIRVKREKQSESYLFQCLALPKALLYLDSIKNIFRVDAEEKRLVLQTDDNSIRLNQEGDRTFVVSDSEQNISAESFDLVNFEEASHQTDLVLFEISRIGQAIKVQVESSDSKDTVQLPHLFNVRPQSFGKEQNTDAEIHAARAKLVIGNSEVGLVANRLEILRFEHKLVTERIVADVDNQRATLDHLKAADPELGQHYQTLFDYCEDNSTLPSLVGWNSEYTELVQHLLVRYLQALESIEPDKTLSEHQKLLVQIGFVREGSKEYIAPFGPLTLAYYLELTQQAANDESFSCLPKVTISRLNSAGLIPYLYTPEAPEKYAHVEPLKQNPAWLEAVSKSNSGLDFLRTLVKDKLKEFLKAYDSLFADRKKGTIKINCVNLGRADDFLKGLLDYYDEHRETSLDIHVNFYDENLVTNALDDFADASSGQEIRAALGIERHKNADILVHLLRTRLTYSKFKMTDEQKYAHLAFFCNITPVIFDQCTLTSSVSGILANGLLSGPAAEREGDPEQAAYFSGFGLRNVTISNDLLRVSERLNCLLRPARRKVPTQFFEGKGSRLTVNTKFREDLRATYQNAIWTVLVDPKVNLDFFSTEKDVVLIHFSDQYTSSAEYDAITVTQERDLFAGISGENLKLSELNAFNGVWLLDMLKANEKTRKERRGILAAYKYLFSLLVRDDITWIPLSVAEMIRVTGNLGLKMKDSDFSRNVQGYKSGAISDDVLFVGFHREQMILLPLEVKSGSVPNYKHAGQQARELARYLGKEILGPRNLKGQLYRSLFMRQVFMQVEKYELYDVFTPSQLEHLSSRREFWLAGNFEVHQLTNYGKGAVIALVDSQAAYQPRFKKADGVIFIELPYALVSHLMEAELKENPEAIAAPTNPDASHLLRNLELGLAAFVPGGSEDSDVPDDDLDSEPQTESDARSHSQDTVKIDVQTESPESGHSITPPKPPKPPEPTLVAKDSEAASGIHALLGHNVIGDKPLVWEPTNTARFLNPNSGIIGTMGTGKTQFTKSLVTQLVRTQHLNVSGKPPGILIFDYKSDYVDDEFLNATGGRKFMPYKLPYNPLSIHGSMPMLPVHTAGGFVETMGRAYHLGPKQRLRLRDVILEAYENCGISRSDRSTWSLPAPTIEKVWRKFDADDKVEQDSLYAALRELSDYKIFEDETDKLKSLYDLVSGVTVIELAGFSPDLQSLIVGLTLDQFYAQMQKSGKPELDGDHRQLSKVILVDEADNFMSQDFPSLRKILKEGREYGVGVVLSTQDIKHFKTSENDYTAYILTWIVHRVAQIQKKDIKSIFNIDDKAAQDRLMEDVRQLEKHYSIYIDGEKNLVKMKDRAFWELMQK